MHVTGGQFKGHKIIIPDCAKPTLSKTRESVFNVLYSYFGDFKNLIFLDLFSGSGVMSLEALSRGFNTISLDIDKKAYNLIKNNLKIAKDGYKIYCSDCIKFIKTNKIKADVIYIDPPWNFDYKKIVDEVIKNVEYKMIVIEYDKKRAQEMHEIYAQTVAPFKEKVYGRCKIDFIKNL